MAIIYIDKNASGANDGSSWADAYTDLKTGVEAATTSDEIRISGDTYNLTATPTIQAGTTVLGGWNGESSESERDLTTNKTKIFGANTTSTPYCFYLNDSTILKDVYLANAYYHALTATNKTGITIDNVKFFGINGSIYLDTVSTVTIRDCVFSGKHYKSSANYGMCIRFDTVTTFVIERCQMIGTGTVTDQGRTIQIFANSTGIIKNNLIIGSQGGVTGGGNVLYADNSSIDLHHNTFIKNNNDGSMILIDGSDSYEFGNNIISENNNLRLIDWNSNEASYADFKNNCLYNNVYDGAYSYLRVYSTDYNTVAALEAGETFAANNIITDQKTKIEITSTLTANVTLNSDKTATLTDTTQDFSDYVGYIFFDEDTNEAYYIDEVTTTTLTVLSDNSTSLSGNNYKILSFRIDSNSSCIDTADDTYLVAKDILETTRTLSEGDVGCYEYETPDVTCFLCDPLPKYSLQEQIAYLVETQQNIENEEQRILLASKANRIVTLKYDLFTESEKENWIDFLNDVYGKKETFVFTHPVTNLQYNAKLETNGLKFKHYLNYLFQFGTIKIKLLECLDTDVSDVTTFPSLNSKMRGYTIKETFYNSEKKFNNGNRSVVNIKKELNEIEISLVGLSQTQLNNLIGFYNYCKGLFKSFTFANPYETSSSYTARFNSSLNYTYVSHNYYECKINLILLEEL